MTQRPILAAVLASAALLAAAPVSAGTFGATRVIRTAASGTEIRVGDIAARGSGVVVGWQENAPGGVKRVWVRRSADGGATFRPAVRLDDRPSRDIEVETCGGWAFAAYTFKESGAWLVGLDKLPLTGPSHEQNAITLDGQSRRPDVACAGERLAVAWFQKVGGDWHVMLHARGVNDEAKGDSLPAIDLDLGEGSMQKGLALAGSGDDLHLAWFDEEEVRLRHWSIGAGPDHDLFGVPTPVLPDMEYGQTPELGVDGDRLVFAYMNRADLRARVSTDGGVSWGPERILENMPFPGEVGAYPTSADVMGTRYLVAGTIVGGIFDDLSGEGFLRRSKNAGGTWKRVPGTTVANGQVVGAYRGSAGNPLLVQAWDRWIADPATDKLRFRRQS